MVVKTQEEGGGTQQSLSNRGDEVEEKEVLWKSRVTQIYGLLEGTLADLEAMLKGVRAESENLLDGLSRARKTLEIVKLTQKVSHFRSICEHDGIKLLADVRASIAGIQANIKRERGYQMIFEICAKLLEILRPFQSGLFTQELSYLREEFEFLVNQPVLPVTCPSKAPNCLQGGGGPKVTCEYEDVAPETGFRGNFEEVGRAFVQAYKEGWRLIKEGKPKNETHQGYVQGEGAGVNHTENGLEPCEDYQGGCTNLEFRCPCQPQGGYDVENKGAKSKSKRSRRGRRRKKRSKKEDSSLDILWWTSESDGEGGYDDRLYDQGHQGVRTIKLMEGV